MKIKNLALDKIIPYARNPRRNDEAVAGVAASIQEFGPQQPIVVDADGVIIVGHTRLKAAQSLGLPAFPVTVAEGLTAAQVKAYRIADNRVGEAAEWDADMLALEIDDLRDMDFDIGLTGFDSVDLDELLGVVDDADNDGGVDEFDLNGIQEKTKIEFLVNTAYIPKIYKKLSQISDDNGKALVIVLGINDDT